MMRFIDLRGQYFLDDDEPKEKQTKIFAYLDTITDQFLIYDGNSIWHSFKDFEEWVGDDQSIDLERLRYITPKEFLE